MIESIFLAHDVLSKDDCKLIIDQAPKAEDYYVAKKHLCLMKIMQWKEKTNSLMVT